MQNAAPAAGAGAAWSFLGKSAVRAAACVRCGCPPARGEPSPGRGGMRIRFSGGAQCAERRPGSWSRGGAVVIWGKSAVRGAADRAAACVRCGCPPARGEPSLGRGGMRIRFSGEAQRAERRPGSWSRGGAVVIWGKSAVRGAAVRASACVRCGSVQNALQRGTNHRRGTVVCGFGSRAEHSAQNAAPAAGAGAARSFFEKICRQSGGMRSLRVSPGCPSARDGPSPGRDGIRIRSSSRFRCGRWSRSPR